jgi:hypothetical protein
VKASKRPFISEQWTGEIKFCPGFECQMTVEISVKGARPRISELVVRAVDSESTVNAKALREVTRDVFRLTELALVSVATTHWDEELGLTPGATMAETLTAFSTASPTDDGGTYLNVDVKGMMSAVSKHSNRKRTDAEWKRIADTYVRAVENGSPVRRAVAAVEGVTDSHAGNLINEARKRKFLPATTQGKRSTITERKGEKR